MNRQSSHLERHIVGAAILVALSGFSPFSAAASYTVTDLGVLPGGGFSSGLGINTAGQVAGTSDAGGGSGQRGVLVGDAGMLNLGLPPVPFVLYSTAPSLNDTGAIIVNGNNGAPHAFIWSAGGFTDITTLPNAVYSEGERINNDGHVVGSVVLELPGGNFPHHAFHYDGKQMIDLNPLFGQTYSDAADINDSGAIVGAARFAGSSIIHGFILQNGVVTKVGPPEITTEAGSINNSGQVAGGAYFDGFHEHPMKYFDGQMTDLGLLNQAIGGTATAINDAGVIVGYCAMSSNPTRAFIYTNGQMIDLNNLLAPGSGWTIEEANDINAAGKIAATARDAQAHKHAVLLTPVVPCPADLNGNGMVNVDDLLAVINAWGASGGPADVNNDGVVNVDDLLAVINAWGSCP